MLRDHVKKHSRLHRDVRGGGVPQGDGAFANIVIAGDLLKQKMEFMT